MGKYKLEWINKQAEHGPVFRINRDVYSRDKKDQRVLRLKAVESYSAEGAEPAVQAFYELAQEWGAPIVYVIEPNLLKPPAGRFLFEWSRRAFENKSVSQSYLLATNTLTDWMGRIVLRIFTDSGMPFKSIKGEAALQSVLSGIDLSCPQEGFSVAEPTTAVVLRSTQSPSLMGSILSRLRRRLSGTSRS